MTCPLIEEQKQNTIESSKRNLNVSTKGLDKKCNSSIELKDYEEKKESNDVSINVVEKKKRKMYRCKLCNDTFSSYDDYKVHYINTHLEVSKMRDKGTEMKGSNSCINTSTRSKAKVVVQIEKGGEATDYNNATKLESVHECNWCGSTFKLKVDLIQHKKKYHWKKKTDINREFICYICGATLNSRSGYSYHLRHVHENIRNFACEVCGHRFTQKHFLKSHMRTHTDERPYVCELCGKAYRCSGSLFFHKKLHNKIYEFQCNVCSFITWNKHRLKSHMDIHSGVKKHSCDICGKAFSCKGILHRHRKIHAVESRYSCSICSRKFKLRAYLLSHMKIKHKQLNVRNTTTTSSN